MLSTIRQTIAAWNNIGVVSVVAEGEPLISRHISPAFGRAGGALVFMSLKVRKV
ncbi:hypothetical protein [Bradyrhizobium centrolobii]|uniref:hypothetical protein n=1 Tax=Bradyrhizobium centrolobii TaxID=1505087 RepID=UPI0013748491|nr:hypothetical protein [Bradyrhizobium centrolobii]